MTTPPLRIDLPLPKIVAPSSNRRGSDYVIPSSAPPIPRMPSILRVAPHTTSPPPPLDQTHVGNPVPPPPLPLEDITGKYDEFLGQVYQKMFDELRVRNSPLKSIQI